MAYSNFFFELLYSPSVEKAKELSTFIIKLLVSFGEKNESSWFGVKMMHVCIAKERPGKRLKS